MAVHRFSSLLLIKFAWPLAKGVSRPRLPTFFSSTNRFFDSLFFHYLIYQVYPARARAAPGGSRRQSRFLDRRINCRKPPFSRFVWVFALLLRFSKFLSPTTGAAHRASIPPLSIITTRFFLTLLEEYTGIPDPAKNKVAKEPFKKFLLVIFML